MNGLIRPRAAIGNIGVYEAGEASISDRQTSIKLSSNENFFGPGKKAIAALQHAASCPERYPPTDHRELKEAIALACDLDVDGIVCGAGSDEILQLLCRAFAGPGDEILYSRHGFLMYPILARSVGATPIAVEETNRRADVGNLLASVSERTRILFLANPNNPTGTMLSESEMRRLVDGLPPSCLLVLDGAYVEYVENFDGGRCLIGERSNVVMTRTFSKIHGLAALRVGFGFGPPEIMEALNRLRMPFNVSGPALAAATAAIGDSDHIKRCRKQNRSLRDRLAAELADCGVESDASSANFILARFEDGKAAHRCDAQLRSDGILVRRMEAYALPDSLRITIGDDDACRRVANSVATFMASSS